MSGSHCPGSTFLAYNPIGGLFNTNASGCPLSKIAQLTVDPTVLVASQSVIPSQWDVVSDFSLSANPNGVWSYGFDGPGRAVTPMGATLANCSNLHINCRITNAGAIDYLH